MELMLAYRTERGPGLTPLVPCIVAGWGRGRWRGLYHVRPLGCACRTYASDAPRPHARRRHWPPPGALCVSHCAGAVPQTPGAEHLCRAGSGAVATALLRPPQRACMAHAYASDTLRSHARRRHTGRAMGLMCVYRTGRGPGLTPLVPGIVAGRGWGSGGEGSAPSAPVGMHGARTRHTRRALKPGAATGRAPGAYARVALSGGRASTLESRASSPGGVGGCGEGPAPSTPVGVHGARYASDAPGPHAQRRHTGRAPGAHVHVPH